jgi:hypothetical protein
VAALHILGLGRERLAGFEELDELLEWTKIVAGAVRVAELGRDAKASGLAMGKPEKGEHSPGIRVLAAGFEIATIGREDSLKAFRSHVFPGERHTDIGYLLGSRRELVEVISGDDSEVVPTSPAACTKEVRLLVLVDAAMDNFPRGFDCEDIDGAEPIDGQAMQAAENTVSSARDVASGADAVTGAAGQGYAVLLIEAGVGITEPCAGADLVSMTAAGCFHIVQHADVDQNAAGIIVDEILVTMSA